MTTTPLPDDVDDRFRGLLAGVRTTITGSSILLSFLLSFPLQTGFGEFDGPQRLTYAVALITTTISTLLLIAPSAQASARYPQSGLRRQTPEHVTFGAYCALAGTVALFVAVMSALTLILSIVYSSALSFVIGGVVGVIGFSTWFGFPIWWTVRD